MKTKLGLLGVALIAGGTLFAQPRVSVGIGVGGYGPGIYPPPAYAQQYAPPCPGPDYTWIDGYWGPQGIWTAGFWRAPIYNSYRVAPRYYAPSYGNAYRGYDRGRAYVTRGYQNGYQRGNERGNQRGNESRGRSYGNGFRR